MISQCQPPAVGFQEIHQQRRKQNDKKRERPDAGDGCKDVAGPYVPDQSSESEQTDEKEDEPKHGQQLRDVRSTQA